MSETEKKDEGRGIPEAEFIQNVESYLEKKGTDPDSLLKELNLLYGKYKYMENSLVTQKRTLLKKIPDINSALTALQYIMKKKEEGDDIDTHFELSSSIYAKAKVKDPECIYLWLGANVMVEYPFEEAEALLTKNHKNAKISLKQLEEDLDFLKDQITVSEVNIARVHNHRVKLKQEGK